MENQKSVEAKNDKSAICKKILSIAMVAGLTFMGLQADASDNDEKKHTNFDNTLSNENTILNNTANDAKFKSSNEVNQLKKSSIDIRVKSGVITGAAVDYEGQSYVLTKVDDKTDADWLVTMYEFNEETKENTPVYYNLELKNTNYGEGSKSQYYKWPVDDEGNRSLVNGTEDEYDIKASVRTQQNSVTHGTVDYGHLVKHPSLKKYKKTFIKMQITNIKTEK